LQKIGRMKSELVRARIEIAGPLAVIDGAVEQAGDGAGAAGVAVPSGPLRAYFQQALIDHRCLFVQPGIAEYPSAQIGDFFCLRLRPESDAGIRDRFVAFALMKQRLAEPAAVHCPFMLATSTFHETGEISIRETAAGGKRGGTGADRGVGYLFSVDHLRYSRGCGLPS
jgi:hypothetical protein